MLYDDLVPRGEWLCHHGIKGQKWHVKNGPPYPLNKTQMSSSEKRASVNNSTKTKSSNSAKDIEDLSSKLNKILESDLITEEDLNKEQKKQGKKGFDINWDKISRFKNAIDIGLNALNKTGRDGYDAKKGITNDDRWWFAIEDQTIGYMTIADMVNRGFTKREILDMVDDSVKINKTMYEDTPNGVFQLAETKYYRNNGWLEKYIDACEESRNEMIDNYINSVINDPKMLENLGASLDYNGPNDWGISLVRF